ncbi:hypothetical protein B0H19DRAFT_1072529 [Mycena capillaripes]|nr:hypothetical protein B0H19DRAFT_1072529 [Mycena capillaripes]
MFFTAHALLSLVVLATSGQGQQLTIDCFDSGDTFACSNFTSAFCSTIGSATIAPGNTISRCFSGPPAPAGFHCDFTTVNNGMAPTVSVVNCNTALAAVAAECPTGGSAVFGNGTDFRFWIDPNTGACSTPDV